MRAMWLHYSDDPTAVAHGDQYLYGRDMLVAPVVEQGATSRTLYLPRGEWYDFWTHEKHAGRREIVRAVDLETMPLYVRAGGGDFHRTDSAVHPRAGGWTDRTHCLSGRGWGFAALRRRRRDVRFSQERVHADGDELARWRPPARPATGARFADSAAPEDRTGNQDIRCQ
jgi:hypothetical protein